MEALHWYDRWPDLRGALATQCSRYATACCTTSLLTPFPGLCNSIWQYQTPFYDGVFCRDKVISDTAQQIGVQSQTFTVIADEAYYYPDLFSGMVRL